MKGCQAKIERRTMKGHLDLECSFSKKKSKPKSPISSPLSSPHSLGSFPCPFQKQGCKFQVRREKLKKS